MPARLVNRTKTMIQNLPFRRIYADNAHLLPQLRLETHQFLIERMRVLGTVGPVLYMSFAVLDYLRYPEQFALFLSIRVVVSVLVLSVVALSYTHWGRRNFVLLTSLAVQVCCHAISMMTALLNGFEDIYFVGNVLIILLGGMFLPWSPLSATLTSFVICGFFLGINLIYHPATLAIATPMFFMVGASIFTVISVLSLEISRLRELIIRTEVQKAHDKIKEEISAARSIQRSLLPEFVQDYPGIRVEALYIPCEDLSGDFFDTIHSGDWLYLYVADVTSHGTAAAQITYLVKELFSQTIAHAPDIDLNALFTWVSQRYIKMNLAYDLGLQLARYHLPTGKFDYLRSNAHNAIILNDASTPPKSISGDPSSRISCAITPDKIHAVVTQDQLKPGESIYLYTDGAIEFETKDGRAYGSRNLLRAFASKHDLDWSEALSTDLKEAAANGSFPDDITILRLRAHREP